MSIWVEDRVAEVAPARTHGWTSLPLSTRVTNKKYDRQHSDFMTMVKYATVIHTMDVKACFSSLFCEINHEDKFFPV